MLLRRRLRAFNCSTDRHSVYFLLNPVAPGLLPKPKFATDSDVVRRINLLIDVDPPRPGNVCATDDEKNAAQLVLADVREYLRSRGWPNPIVADSGNGWHLIYRIDVPNDEVSCILVRRVLQALSARFKSDAAKIDTSVFDAPRLCRLYGTVNRKGEHTADRPHRTSKILEAPHERSLVPVTLLEQLAEEAPSDEYSFASQATDLNASPQNALVPRAPASARVVSRAKAYVAKIEGAIDGQGGDARTWRVACILVRDFGLTVEQAVPIMNEFNLRCQPPWSAHELQHKFEYADNWNGARGWRVASEKRHADPKTSYSQAEIGVSGGERSVGTLPFEPFPLGAIPARIVSFVTETAAALGCDPVFVAIHVLAVLAGVLGNKFRIALKKAWHEPAVIWTVIIAESGTLKSPGWEKAVAPLYEIEEQLRIEHSNAMEKFDADLAEWVRNKGNESATPKPTPPARRRVIAGDVTVEKLAQILHSSPHGILVTRDELAGWMQGFNQYKTRSGADVSNWLEMYRAGPVQVDRVKDGGTSLFIRRAAVSVCGTIQPDVFFKLMTDQFRASGFTARLLVTMPPKCTPVWTDADVDTHTLHAYRDLVRQLYDIPTTDDPVAIQLSNEAKALWVTFYNEWNRDVAKASGDKAAALAKLVGYAARFALLHHVVTNFDGAPSLIGPDSVAAGITLARWFAKEAERVYEMFKRNPEQAQADRLLAYVETKGSVNTRMVRDWDRSRYPDDEAAESALFKLVSHGLLMRQERKPNSKGGRPAVVFVPTASE